MMMKINVMTLFNMNSNLTQPSVLTKLCLSSIIFILPVLVSANHTESGQAGKPRLTISHDSNHTYSSNDSNNAHSSHNSTSSHSSVTISSSSNHSNHSNHSRHHHSNDHDLLYIFLDVFDDALFFGGIASMERVEGGDSLGLTPRVEGELLLPFFKFDASALSSMTENEIGSDMSFEMGYGAWGMHYRNTSFVSDATFNSVSSFNQFNFLYRMSFGSEFELDFGLGSYQVDDQMQFSMSLPMKIAFTPHNIVEFRPTWSQEISDYDLAIYSGTEFYSFKVGYRYIAQLKPFSTTPAKAYSNIYAGFSAHY